MKIAIREKALNNGKSSLYLDLYQNGKRKYKFLKLYVTDNPKSSAERNLNKEMRRKAELIRIHEENELINKKYSLAGNESNIRFLEYFRIQAEARKKSKGNYGNWDSVHKILVAYFGDRSPKISEINDEELLRIKKFILTDYRTKSDTALSQNAASSYFNKVKACLREAFNERLINENPANRVKAIKPEETHREFLTEEEIKKLISTDCESDVLKRAFLVGVFTGLRWSDVIKLRWSDFSYSADTGYSIKYTQQKTKGAEILPVSEIVFSFIGEMKANDEKVFKGLKYSAWNNVKISKWMLKAKIDKHATFHTARHSFATLMLSKDVDIYTVSKLLGHKNISTTQIYAKVIDQRKIAAVSVFDSFKKNP